MIDYSESESQKVINELTESYMSGLEKMRSFNEHAYQTGKRDLKLILNRYHFDAELLACAYQHWTNSDGTTSPKWTIEQTNSVAKEYDIPLAVYNCYDINYILNFMYSDYAPVFGNDMKMYAKLTVLFISDKDAPEGKAVRHYLAMHTFD